jgi:hypothetical protein
MRGIKVKIEYKFTFPDMGTTKPAVILRISGNTFVYGFHSVVLIRINYVFEDTV